MLVKLHFRKNTKTQIKLKPIFFFLENQGHIFVENTIILRCAKIQRKISIFGEVRAPKRFFWGLEPSGYRT